MIKDIDTQAIFACIDGSHMSESVCQYASWIAKANQRPLTLLHTIEHNQTAAVADLSGALSLGASEDLLSELTDAEQKRSKLLVDQGHQMLQLFKQQALELGIDHVKTMQQHGHLVESLIDLEQQVRCLVIGIRGEQHDDQRAGIGAQLETTLRTLHKPMLVVNKEFSQPKTIMLAYDGSESCNKALQMIVERKVFEGLPCHLVHVEKAQSDINQTLHNAQQQLQQAGHDVTVATVIGDPAETLAKYQIDNDIDLMLMGAFSHNRFRDLLLGSFTAKMLDKTNRPLLLLR
ncbi:MAG: universal stress protein [Kangiellaceae bacterium]|jgi:nucleotide-binding universal stress UspA family protein|nr:universal stress protein [Kangiellaceae bacterium]